MTQKMKKLQTETYVSSPFELVTKLGQKPQHSLTYWNCCNVFGLELTWLSPKSGSAEVL